MLADKLQWTFLDTDGLIVEKFQRTIPQIFAEDGEAYFRGLETEVLRFCANQQNAVIATGGGIILRKENIPLLKENSRVYFINRPLEELECAGRPLSCSFKALEIMQKQRLEIYIQTADFIVENVHSPEYIIHKILGDWYENSGN